MVHSPLPKDLRETCNVASKILREFTIPTAAKGPDSVIPATILKNCKGLAIITIAKAGFLVTARAGAGLVVARTPDGWSAPSALGVAGIGGGFELGVEVTDFLLVLNTERAVTAFSKGTNVTFGANLTIAVGPLGRNAEASVSARSVASVYSYSKSKGLFGGVSLEASTLLERKEANHKFYNDDSIRASAILRGDVSPPDGARNLYVALNEADNAADRSTAGGGGSSVSISSPPSAPRSDSGWGSSNSGGGSSGSGGGGWGSSSGGGRPPPRARPSAAPNPHKKPSTGASTGINLGGNIAKHVPKSWERSYQMSSTGRASTRKLDISIPAPKHQTTADTSSDWEVTDATKASLDAWSSAPVVAKKRTPVAPPSTTNTSWDSSASTAYPPPTTTSTTTTNLYPPTEPTPSLYPPPSSNAADSLVTPADAIPLSRTWRHLHPESLEVPVTTAHALFDFSSTEEGDLCFRAGEHITLLTQTPTQNDWWEGELNGVKGIFPANYVQVDQAS